MFTDPVNPFAQVITPEVLMEPADGLLVLQLSPVLLAAVVV